MMEGGKIVFDIVFVKIFFSFMLGNIKEGYFVDLMYGGNQKMGGWKMVGFFGVCVDYVDWVD